MRLIPMFGIPSTLDLDFFAARCRSTSRLKIRLELASGLAIGSTSRAQSLDRYIRGGSPAVPAVNPPEMGQSKPKGRSGRRPGTGSWDVADKPLLEEMHRLITDGLAKSPNDAARQLADKAKGNSIRGIKADAPRQGIPKKIYPSEPNSSSPNFSDPNFSN